MKVTVSTFDKVKQQGGKFSVVSCYDYTSARLCILAGVDAILVGDSAAQFLLGFDSTLPIQMDFMAAITAGVSGAASEKLIIADLPYESCNSGSERMLADSKRFVNDCGADIVKIEASAEQFKQVKNVIDSGLAVMPHIGLRPQSGKYKAEGTTAEMAAELIELADKFCDAGSRMLLLEGVAREAAAIITKRVKIPVISCGSGPDCDGQVLVLPDILSLAGGSVPKFSKSFAGIGQSSIEAIARYDSQVKQGIFPDDEHSYHMKSGEYEKLERLIS